MSERMKNLALRSIEAFIHGSTLKLDGKPGGHRNLKHNNNNIYEKNLFPNKYQLISNKKKLLLR